MNRKVILVVALTLVALVVLGVYSFGPWRQNRLPSKGSPASLRPSPVPTPAQTPAPTPAPAAVPAPATSVGDLALVAYHNRDAKENFYTVALPKDWRVSAGKAPGSYAVSFDGGSGSVDLMDVPDNSTLALYVLSQEEPRLKKELGNYQRVDYRKMQVNGNEAHQLIYMSQTGSSDTQTVRTYVAGQDRAAVVTLSVKPDGLAAVQATFSAVLGSFQWEN